MKKNLKYLMKKKDRDEKITMLSCYDHPTAKWSEDAGVDIVLVGDSLGVNLLGYENAEQVTMEDMLHHFKAVQRAIKEAYLIVDLPLASLKSPEQALKDSQTFMDSGADAVKIESFDQELIAFLLDNYIEVCLDLIYPFAKEQYSVTEKDESGLLVALIKMAMALQKHGLGIFMLTMFPQEAAKAATELLSVPVIGVGSGKYTNGQALIVTEMIGMVSAKDHARYVKQLVNVEGLSRRALAKFIEDTGTGIFPSDENCDSLDPFQFETFMAAVNQL